MMADHGISNQPVKNKQKLHNFAPPSKSLCDYGHHLDDDKSEYSCASMVTHS